MPLRTKFLYKNDKPIGRVDEAGNIYTLSGRVSWPHYHTPAGVAVNKAHQAREEAALEVEFDDDED